MNSVIAELQCQFCTFINDRGIKICNACGRTLGLPTINLNSNGIDCLQCTYKNPYGTVKCQMCEAPIVKQENETIIDVTMDMDMERLCQICYSNLTVEFKMPGCTHIFCQGCAKQHFTIKIMECGINNIRCPIDVCTSFDELPNKPDFFKLLKRALSDILDAKTEKAFEDKISILEIMDQPGFLRCSLCNHGFINRSKGKMVYCPECLKSFCSQCGKKWIKDHPHTSCKQNGNGEDSENGDVQIFCNAFCPQCKFKYFLERGGCMHITCCQCSYEYCEFCFKQITGKGKLCGFPNCSKGQSLHGHHPRNCMYYVREMDHTKLEQLLKKNGVRYSVVQQQKTTECAVKVNKSIGDNWLDSICKEPAAKCYNNMCLFHYKWHLGELLKKHNIDPVDVMNNLECLCELKRNNVQLLPIKPTYSQPIVNHETTGLRTLVRSRVSYQPILQ